MENNEISIHEVKIYLALKKSATKWLSNQDISELVKPISRRTVRGKTLKFSLLGLLDQAEVFPAHRFRWSEKAEKRNHSYCLRLKTAAEVFGLVA